MSDTTPEPVPEPGPEPAADAAPESAPGQPPESIEELRSRAAEAEDQRLRALADLDNLRKRCAAQVSRAAATAATAVAAEWLPVVDNLDRALTHSRAEPEAIIDGVRAVRNQALAVLAKLGFARRDDMGEMFDPARHDAVATRPAKDADAGTVVEVLQAGYGEGDHQLRPAQVVVAQEPAG
ncbi:MAG TPA: nucleotide exchange factor GrpE [Streptosporangiaceae bacterium]|nr:nucleotide exchange factor GrpE [Streptosporangiaceae bacterium]